MSFSTFLRLFAFGTVVIISNVNLIADPISDPTGDTLGLTLVQPTVPNTGLPPLQVQVLPGSQMIFSLYAISLGGTAPIHDFSFELPYAALINPTFTSDLPSGWTYSLVGNTFTAANNSGSDLNPSQVSTDLGTFTLTVDPTAAGTEFDLNDLSNITLDDANGNAIQTQPQLMEETHVTVAPEPPAVWLLMGSLAVVFGLGGLRALKRS